MTQTNDPFMTNKLEILWTHYGSVTKNNKNISLKAQKHEISNEDCISQGQLFNGTKLSAELWQRLPLPLSKSH